ncbi:hypothetical protein GR160_07835 [Flavobacterium sp. Sd200]|uniref:hypothetical protein n=1 Tax=Flavobacterium sp. Sd200 TaxID=2692211 RepID=UPI00136D3C65|nr:hypothetical protein [Flavobacterium sp. Sd200]MXN91139.1 hypothetical protein [Flavobacterium sp. Sd200]
MLTKDDAARVFDTMLSIPGMNEMVKIDLKISRKNVLLLNQVIGHGLSAEGGEKEAGLLSAIAKENLQELKDIAQECLQKAGLIEFNEKINSLGNSK